MYNEVQNFLSCQIKHSTESGDKDELNAMLKRYLELDRERKDSNLSPVPKLSNVRIFPKFKSL